MRKNIVLKPEHLTMMMIANAREDDEIYPDSLDLLGIVRALCQYAHGEEMDQKALTNAGEWVISEIIDAQEENNGNTEV